MTVNPSRLLEARLLANLSQDDLALKAGTSQKNIWRWENGKNEPRMHFVAAIASATGKDVSFFLTEDGASDEEASDPVADLMTAFERYARWARPEAAA